MTLSTTRFQQLLEQSKLPELFNEYGWDRPTLQAQTIFVHDTRFTLTCVAEKRGVVVLRCSPDANGNIPARPILLKIEQAARKFAHEHLLVFADAAQTTLTWLWVLHAPGQPTSTRTHTWHKGQSGEALRQKLSQIVWSLEEEEAITLTDVITGLRNAFDRDRVSKSFYDAFKRQHDNFAAFISGLNDTADQSWYASLMLNRLMFVYFIQKKGFLEGDENYLATRMAEIQAQRGKGKFHSFYRQFLRRLFHEGLGQPQPRDASLNQLIGKNIPYLNGGLFDVHELEAAHTNIDVPDEAFENLFAFFNQWDWHLDDRPLASGREINPDVLGYIFEKYINQKQMGAYYTKEDITEYISKNTIIPHLLDQAQERCQVAFDGAASVWELLAADPDRYIYPAMKTGVIDASGQIVPESALPDFVQTGMHDAKTRMFERRYNLGEASFNTATSERGTLPTETWREYVDRRSRCLALRDKLAQGQVCGTDELITLNLNIRQFMQDVIDTTTSPDLLRAVWQAIVGSMSENAPGNSDTSARHGITILDPTCGSGAFLFAALGILEPLYEACLDRMEGFIEDAAKTPPPAAAQNKKAPNPFADFQRALAEVNQHPSRRYYIYKSIILHNLFGVDIMAEAVEICKLRLFLKLVSQVDKGQQLEPLPDIDFNIRTGNTLVGYATQEQFKPLLETISNDYEQQDRIIADLAHLSTDFDRFRQQQTMRSAEGSQQADKHNLREQLAKLSLELDRYLARDYGIDADKKKAFADWRASHQPFHWFAEFYGVMRTGGFDVVIGNPPYVAKRTVTSYSVKGYATGDCPDIYAWCLERVLSIAQPKAHTGMIVPLSLSFSSDFDPLRKLLYARYRSNWFSHFAKRPSMLFNGVQIRNTIHLGTIGNAVEAAHTTKLHRWHTTARSHLFEQLTYTQYQSLGWKCVPKSQSHLLLEDLCNRNKTSNKIQTSLTRHTTEYPIYFKKIGYNWISFGHFTPPAFDRDGTQIEQNEFGLSYARTDIEKKILLLFLNGKIAFLYWVIVGDDFHLTKGNFAELPFDLRKISTNAKKALLHLADELENRLSNSVVFMTMHGKRLGNFNSSLLRSITEKSDQIFAEEFGLLTIWDEFELAHSQIVRTSGENQNLDVSA